MRDYRAEGVLISDKGHTRHAKKRAAIDDEQSFAREVGIVIRQHRMASGLNMEQLAKRSYCHAATIEYLEAGTIDPTLSVLRRVLGALGLELRCGFLKAD